MACLIHVCVLLSLLVIYCSCERDDPAMHERTKRLLRSPFMTVPESRNGFKEDLAVLRGEVTRIDYDYDETYVKLSTLNRCVDPTGASCNQTLPLPTTVVMLEASSNHTFRDFLHICTDIEAFEVDLNGDLDSTIEALFSKTFSSSKTSYSKLILLVNVEQSYTYTLLDLLQSITDVSQNFFTGLSFYADFEELRNLSSLNNTELEDVDAWFSQMCQSVSCADFSSLVIESISNIDVNNNGSEIGSLVSNWCQKLGFNDGTRIVDLVPDTTFDMAGSGYTESSLVLSDILPLNTKSYDKNRPPKYQNQPTVVYFHVTVLSLDTINEESMTYVADIFLAQSWRDHRLRLPENMTSDYRILDVVWLQHIWRPDSFFKNAKKVTFHEMSVPNHYLWLYYDKTLLYMTKLTLVLSCAMKFEAYPHDTQICSIMIESLSHTTDDLVFKWNITDPLVSNPDIELPQLDIARNTTEDCTLEYSTGNFTCLAVVFNLKRRLGYHLFHTYIPSALIVVMSWISFWIKPEAIPARVTLGVTSLLTLATQSTQSQRSLPPVSYVKAIDVWMSSCTVFVFMSLMEFAVVNNFMGPVATKPMKGYSDEDIPNAQFNFANGRGSIRSRGSAVVTAPGPQYVTFCHGREVALFIDKWSRLFFPFSFIILNIVYWTTFYV